MDEARETSTPLLVYNRIDSNRRKARLLLISFAVALLPVVSGVAAFIVPWSAMYASGMRAYLLSRAAQSAVEFPDKQNDAEVYVDGYFAGTIKEFDGHLALTPGPHNIKVSAPGHEPFYQFDVNIQPPPTIPYQGRLDLLDLTTPGSWLYGGVLLVSMALVALALVATSAFLISLYARVVLRRAHARLVSPGQERDLVQVVEHLCIGAGLPLPRIYVIESAAPNAFALGRHPHDASLVVTRGLRELLDRRELEGVIAHELSHIGNHDIGLSTMLAALVGTLSLPLRVLSALFRWAPFYPILMLILSNLLILLVDFLAGCGRLNLRPGHCFAALRSGEFWQGIPSYLMWWGVYALMVPLYAVFVAPVVALLIRQAVSRQREFLADADAALLTRDPEGLALALVKIGAAVGGEQLGLGEGTAHLYFVDPLSKGSWLHVVFPSHPPLEKRVELLARMGNGIAPSAIQAARDAGARFQFTKSGPEEVHAPLPDAPSDETVSSTQTTEPTGASDDGFTRLDDRPDVGFHVEPAVAADHALTPLFEQPDGWSRVLAQLPENAVVIPITTEGHFVRVTTAEHQAGYVSRSAPLTALKNFQE